MRGGMRWWLGPWLMLVAAAQVVGFEVVRRAFVDTRRGQLLDTASLAGNRIGHEHIDELVDIVLSAMTVLSLAAATAVIGFIALMRRRALLAAAATLLIVGANLTTQLLKYAIERPELGVDLARAAAGNSLPSGHTTVAASVAVALVLVLPHQLRPVAALTGAGYAALAGVATLSAGWHRPSDAVAAMLVVGVWAAVISLWLMIANRGDRRGELPAHRRSVIVLALIGLVALLLAAIAMVLTDRAVPADPEWLSERRLFAAYAGGAAGIAGSAALVMALVMATVHVAVPSRSGEVSGRRAARAAAAAEPPTAVVPQG